MAGEDGAEGQHPATGAGSDDAGKGATDDGANASAVDDNAGETTQARGVSEGTETEGLTAAALKGDGEGEPEAKPSEVSLNINLDNKPDNVPDQFWDGENKQLKVESIIKQNHDQLTEIKKLRSQGKETPPESAEDYTFEPPEDAKYQFENADDDPGMKIYREIAHKYNLSQSQFQGFLNDFLNASQDAGLGPADINNEVELKKLGDNGAKIVEHVANMGQKFKDDGAFSERDLEEYLIATSSAEGVNMMRKVHEYYGGSMNIPTNAFNEGEGLPSSAELYDMIASDKYANDSAYRAKVDNWGAQVWGNQPAGESARGVGVKTAQPLQGKPANPNLQ